MEQANAAWNLLREAEGSYQGAGINHENQSFMGSFALKSLFPEKLISLKSSAIGKLDEVFHEEYSWIGPDLMGTLALYVSSNNHPGVTRHDFNRIEEEDGVKKIIFRFGDIEDRNSFREEIAISIFSDGQVSHFYSWGLPGGDFEIRSGSKMKRI